MCVMYQEVSCSTSRIAKVLRCPYSAEVLTPLLTAVAVCVLGNPTRVCFGSSRALGFSPAEVYPAVGTDS